VSHADSIDRHLENARTLSRMGRSTEAEAAYRTVLATSPDHAEALRFLGRAALARNDHGDAVTLLSRALRATPDDAPLLVELGMAYREAERPDAARYVLDRAVALSGAPGARLVLADVLERDERPDLALLHYCRALADAQRTRAFDPSADASIMPLMRHAERYVQTGRRAWFNASLRGLRELHPQGRWDRIDTTLAMYLREREMQPGDARQQPGFMFVPRLETRCFPDAYRFDFALSRASELFAPLEADVASCLAGIDARPGRLPIILRGIPQYEARNAISLLAALGELPLVRIDNHAPDVEIIQLPPGANIPRHFGRMNSRCRIVVNLTGAAPLDISVGGEHKAIAAGAAVAIDPSFGVEYANLSATQSRAVVFDVWHPDLSGLERDALTALILAAVEFDTRMQELA
jgi:aspartate beta-hydroxylase